MHDIENGLHFGFGHWAFGIMSWLVFVLVVVSLVKYFFKE